MSRGTAPDREGWSRHNRREKTLKAVAANWKLARNDRAFVVHLAVQYMSDGADHGFGRRSGQLTRRCDAVAQAFYEQFPVGVQHDFDHARIIEGHAKMIAESILQLAEEARK